ncbi:kinase-like domain-containing protein [Suillus ampliporus]|nr:kinase-like domain-containing protein [Suillus ampliporus]
MPSTFEIPYIPDLTDQIIKSKLFVTSGGYADVYKCMWNSPSESSPVAVKVFRPRFGQSNRSNLREAIKVWGRLQNDHILPLLGLVHGYGPSPALVSPWMDNGTLMNFLNERHDTLKRCERLRLLQDIALALQYRMLTCL